MSQPPRTFHVRLPVDLKDKLESAVATTGKSLNREILDRLELSFHPDAALRLADSIRPILDKLDEGDREKVVTMVADTFAILVNKRGKR